MSKVFVIAEAGISHDGDLDKALQLIDVARQAGADAVKFQTFNAQKLAARRKNPDLYAKLKPYEMPLTWLPVLKEAADKAKIEFMTTCFDEETLKIVAPFVKRFKISHVEAKGPAFVEAHKEYGKPIIASVIPGYPYTSVMAGLGMMHCTELYPTPVNQVHLEHVWNVGGFSDHTQDLMMGALAVACHAIRVEVHFRLWDTDKDNPDLCVSHPPPNLIRYVENLRHAELAVYGAASEETKILRPDGSAPHTSHRQGLDECDQTGVHPRVP